MVNVLSKLGQLVLRANVDIGRVVDHQGRRTGTKNRQRKAIVSDIWQNRPGKNYELFGN